MVTEKFTGKEGEPTTIEIANKWRMNYEKSCEVRGHFFGKEKIQQLLDIDGSVGIRIYYGLNDQGGKELLLYAVRSDMSDIVPGDKSAFILDISKKCPPYCR